MMFPIFCINRQVANNLSANLKLSKTQISEIIKSVGFLCRLLGPLMKVFNH